MGSVSPALVLRPASRADIDLLRHWDRQPHVIAADPDSDWQWETELGRDADWREQLIAELDGRPIGYLEILDCARDPEQYWEPTGNDVAAIDIWIGERDALGQGHGTEMMRQALARCFARPRIRRVRVDPLSANTRAHRFYERCGFRRLGERRFENDNCVVFEVTRDDWKCHTINEG